MDEIDCDDPNFFLKFSCGQKKFYVGQKIRVDKENSRRRKLFALSPAAGRGKFGDSTTSSRTRLTDGGVFLSGAAADPKRGPDGAAGGVGAMGVSATVVAASEESGEGLADEQQDRAAASSSAVVALRANSGGERNGA